MVSVLSVPSITLIFYLFKQRRMPIQNEHPFSFVFGGFESSAKWKGSDLWQPGEAPTEKELARAHESLAACENKVDYVLAHKNERGVGTVTAGLWDLYRFIDEKVEYRHFYAGHKHIRECVDEKHMPVYDRLICLDCGKHAAKDRHAP